MARQRVRVLAIGDAIVDQITPPMPHLPRGDFQGHVERFETLPGGNATNFALQMGRLGASTTFRGVLGRDANANLLREAYRQHGVRAIVREDPRQPTGSTMALSWTGGGRALITSLGANGGFRLEDVPPSSFRDIDHVHRAGYWWTPRLIGRPTATLLRRARRAGAVTSLDMSTDPRGWPRDRLRSVRLCLPFVNVFFGNETEVCALGGRPSPSDAARRICQLGAGEVVVHRGARGSVWTTPDKSIRAAAFPVAEENPTGCGDVFNAAYAFARLEEAAVLEALRFANAASALHLKHRTRPYPGISEIRRFLAGRSARS